MPNTAQLLLKEQQRIRADVRAVNNSAQIRAMDLQKIADLNFRINKLEARVDELHQALGTAVGQAIQQLKADNPVPPPPPK